MRNIMSTTFFSALTPPLTGDENSPTIIAVQDGHARQKEVTVYE